MFFAAASSRLADPVDQASPKGHGSSLLRLALLLLCLMGGAQAVVAPTVTTTIATPSSVTGISASAGGNVTNAGDTALTARGVCWSTATGPAISDANDGRTVNGDTLGIFSSSLTGLMPGKTYYYRAYATNSVTAYGDEMSFTTDTIIPSLDIPAPPSPAATYLGATLSVSVYANGDDAGTTCGIYWSNVNPPEQTENNRVVGTLRPNSLIFDCLIPAGILKGSTTYYAISYATNRIGTSYGSGVTTFTTADAVAPTVTGTLPASAIAAYHATSGGLADAVNYGGANDGVIQRGICWSTSNDVAYLTLTSASDLMAIPPILVGHTTEGGGTGAFTSILSGLAPNTIYYYRAYATSRDNVRNVNLTGYDTLTSPIKSVTTLLRSVPDVTTGSASGLTDFGVTLTGHLDSDGNDQPAGMYQPIVTETGVCWNTNPNPTIANNPTPSSPAVLEVGSDFTISLTTLSPGTTYYFRAYATNSLGTGYGRNISFTTSGTATMRVITNPSPGVIGRTSFVSGGEAFGTMVRNRGICWSTSSSPSLPTNNKTSDGTIPGVFTSTITGLIPKTKYYYRAYVTDSIGNTSYGTELNLTTYDNQPPTAYDDAFSLQPEAKVNRSLVALDVDRDPQTGAIDMLTYALVTNPTLGTVTLNPVTGAYSYVAQASPGDDFFTFRVSDGITWGNTATVMITVYVPESPPASTGDGSGSGCGLGAGAASLILLAILALARMRSACAIHPDGGRPRSPSE